MAFRTVALLTLKPGQLPSDGMLAGRPHPLTNLIDYGLVQLWDMLDGDKPSPPVPAVYPYEHTARMAQVHGLHVFHTVIILVFGLQLVQPVCCYIL